MSENDRCDKCGKMLETQKFLSYPIRPKKERRDLFKTCTCGHFYYEHSDTLLSMFQPYGTSRGKCKVCMCPKYDKLGDLTWEEVERLRKVSRITGKINE